MQLNPMLKSIHACFLMSVFAMWNFFLFWGFTPAIWADTAEFDQVIRFTSSPNPVGSGARALGMGGAFIAICDDATAASWNPAGLVQLEKPELSVVYDYHKNDVSSHYEAFPNASVSDGGVDHSFNYLSAAYPFKLFSRNMTASLNYQHLYDFKNDSSRRYEEKRAFSTLTDVSIYSLDGELWAISPAFSIQMTPSFSIGVTLNFWEDGLFDNQWTTSYNYHFQNITKSPVIQREDSVYSESYKFSGFNYHLGALWSVTSRLTVGAVMKAPFTADLDYHYHSEIERVGDYEYVDDPMNTGENETLHVLDIPANETLEMPMSLGLGISFRLTDAFSVALDVYKTWWKDYLLHTNSGKTISPISGVDESDSSVGNTTQVRAGAEYLIIKEKFIVPIRLGLFHDPEPSINGTVDFWGVALGSGLVWKNFALDFAFQYRTGDDVVSILANEELIQDKSSHTFYTSLIYYF